MMSRAAHAGRQGKLRLLESMRVETVGRRKQLEEKHLAIPALSWSQGQGVLAPILEMPADAIVDFFSDYPLRMTGENPFFYVYGDPRDPPHKDDPDLAAAVEAVNLALLAYDRARLNLRVAELFNGRIAPGYSKNNPEGPAWTHAALVRLNIFEILVSATKAISFYESLRGGDLRAVERNNFDRLWSVPSRARSKREALERSTHGDPITARLATHLL
jgi:hypothetical protein